jgi:hypothetical protein
VRRSAHAAGPARDQVKRRGRHAVLDVGRSPRPRMSLSSPAAPTAGAPSHLVADPPLRAGEGRCRRSAPRCRSQFRVQVDAHGAPAAGGIGELVNMAAEEGGNLRLDRLASAARSRCCAAPRSADRRMSLAGKPSGWHSPRNSGSGAAVVDRGDNTLKHQSLWQSSLAHARCSGRQRAARECNCVSNSGHHRVERAQAIGMR